MIESILFSTDFSPLSRKAFRYAIALAKRTESKVTVCYALSVPAPVYSVASLQEYTGELNDSALDQLNQFVTGDDLEGIEVKTRLCIGAAEHVLNDLAAELEADLVVVARHSRSTLERFFMGSTTEKILHSSGFPVLIVPQEVPEKLEWNPVLCAVDFSSASEKVLKFSVRLVREYGQALSVLHVVESGVSIERIASKPMRAKLDVLVEHARKQLEQVVEGQDLPAGTQTRIAEGKPASTIVEEAEELGADLITVGERGHGLLERMAIGSTTSAIVRGAHVPVLVIPSDRLE